MSEGSGYTLYHPRWLRSRVSTYWWLGRRSYLAFILRELSSVFIAWFVLFLLMLVKCASQGDAAYQQFLERSKHPLMIFVNVVTLFFVVFHAITWFNLAPQAMVVRLGRTRVPGVLIAGSNYAAWVVASALLAWLLAGGQ